MKLTVILAQSTRTERGGTISVIGLGITAFNFPEFPAAWPGAVVMVAEPDDKTEAGVHPVKITMSGPGPDDDTNVMEGELTWREPKSALIAEAGAMLQFREPGEYALVFECGGNKAISRISVTQEKQ